MPLNVQLASAGFGLVTGLPQELVQYFMTPQFQQQISAYIDRSSPTSTYVPPRSTSQSGAQLSLTASSTSVRPGMPVTLNWHSSQASTCTASGAWQGSKSLSGSQMVGPIYTDQRFLLSCSGISGGAVAEVNVTLQRQDLSLQLQVSRNQVPVNSTVELSWTATNADYCLAGRDWSGHRAVSGTFAVGPLTETATFDMTCFRGSQRVVQLVSVNVKDHILRWQPPTANADGSLLQNIGGYKIYWGTEPKSYSDSISVPADTTEWWADLQPGMYYFAMSTIDSQGVESHLSQEVAIPIQ